VEQEDKEAEDVQQETLEEMLISNSEKIKSKTNAIGVLLVVCLVILVPIVVMSVMLCGYTLHESAAEEDTDDEEGNDEDEDPEEIV
jgi:hypothetical protein